jgi:hypothetical protein
LIEAGVDVDFPPYIALNLLDSFMRRPVALQPCENQAQLWAAYVFIPFR